MKFSSRLLAVLLLAGGFAPLGARGETATIVNNAVTGASNLAFDRSGNLFVASAVSNLVQELTVASAYATVTTIGLPLSSPGFVAADSNGNIFIADPVSGSVFEAPASGGHTSLETVVTGVVGNIAGFAVDSSDDIFFCSPAGSTVTELVAAGGYQTSRTLGSGLTAVETIAIDADNNIFLQDVGVNGSSGEIKEIVAAGGYATTKTLISNMADPLVLAVDRNENIFISGVFDGVVEFPAAGGYQNSTSHPGSYVVASMVVDAAGNLFVIDSEQDSLDEISAAGNYDSVQTLVTGLSERDPLTIDSSGNLYFGDVPHNALTEVSAASGHTAKKTLLSGFAQPMALAVDSNGNVFVADFDAIQEVPAAGGYSEIKTIVPAGAANGVFEPSALAVDSSGNLFVADTDNSAVKEIPAAGGYTTIKTLGDGFSHPFGITLDAGGNVFVADTGNLVIREILAAGGYTTLRTILTDNDAPTSLALDSSGNIILTDGVLGKALAVGGFATIDRFYDVTTPENLGFGFAAGATAIAPNGGVYFIDFTSNGLQVFGGPVELLHPNPPTPIAAAVLPGARAVDFGTTATIFATMINTGATDLDNCQIALPPPGPQSLQHLALNYQTTDPTTNALTGTPDTPVTIPGNSGVQTFLLAFTDNFDFAGGGHQELVFECDGAPPADILFGIDTFDLSLEQAPVADILALVATPTNNGIIDVPTGGAAAFSIASMNLGVGDNIGVTVDTGLDTLPIVLSICQTNPTNGQCLASPAATVDLSYAAGAVATFSVFLQAGGPVAFDPASARIFVRFRGSLGANGSTSVAVQTP